jgi:5-methyltetrahydropteroyltriglutamate--homocysteine methyltransferase
MSEQAQDDFYGDGEAVAMAYAGALREEIVDLFSAGADIVQIDEPWMQSRPEKARQYGLQALNAALEGIEGETAVHICFGYAAVMNAKPAGYSFLSELRGCNCRQVSMETAQPKLDCEVLATLDNKRLMVGCIDLSDQSIETPEVVVERIDKALRYVRPERVILAPDCGMKYLPREVADGKMRAMSSAAKILRLRYQ